MVTQRESEMFDYICFLDPEYYFAKPEYHQLEYYGRGNKPLQNMRRKVRKTLGNNQMDLVLCHPPYIE